jgi:AraC-like DNA-binding protein
MSPTPPHRLQIEERGLRHASFAGATPSMLADLQRRAPAPNLFDGCCRRFGIRPGFDLSVFDFTMSCGFPEGGTAPPGLTVTVMLDGAGEGFLCQPGQPASDVPIPYASGLTYLCYSEVPVVGRSRLPAGCRFRAAELRLALPFLDSIGMLADFRGAGPGHPLCRVTSEGVWIGVVPTPEPLAGTAAELVRTALSGECHDLLIEKATLDILTTAMALMRRPPVPADFAPRDGARLRHARDLILADPAKPWTIRGLSRQVGLNEKKLKSGFRAQFHNSVKGVIQDARLSAAHVLLTRQGASVTAAALAVGYANPSHFAMLFRRRYGVPPAALLGRAAVELCPREPAAAEPAALPEARW